MLFFRDCLPPLTFRWLRPFIAAVTLVTLAACTTAPRAAPTATSVAVPGSRFVYLPPIDDGGKTSGPHAVTICLPAGYDSTSARYPVIYVLDGEAAFFTRQHGMRDAVGYEVVHDQLVHEGLIQPAIFVAVHNSTDAAGHLIRGNRHTDYIMSGQTYTTRDGVERVDQTRSEGYYEFLAKTIKPMIDRTYRTRPGPESTGVAGFSAGGSGAFWMTYVHPETFGMGICQSPAFMPPFAGRELQAMLADRTRPVPAVRLWMDAGSQEYDFIYKDAFAAYRKLVRQGFKPGENIAFYTGHGHGHEKFDCYRRMRSALYFMLRTTAPELTAVELTTMDTVNDGPIRLERPAHLVVEAVYDHWLRLTDGAATFTIADPAVVRLDPSTNEIRPVADGHTTVRSSYAGRQLVQRIVVPPPEALRLCSATTRPVVMDGNLGEWGELPYKVDAPLDRADATTWTGAADLSYRFACIHDENFLYLAIATTDDHLVSETGKDPWYQDGIEVRVDARPASERMFSPGEGDGNRTLLVALSPSQPGVMRLPYKADKLPAGIKAVCIATATGYNTEIAIPVTYLNEQAGNAWKDVRINVVVDDLDMDLKGSTVDKMWWRPDWRTPASVRGSGTFLRQ
jgi:enterochelin esterase-like enzyme